MGSLGSAAIAVDPDGVSDAAATGALSANSGSEDGVDSAGNGVDDAGFDWAPAVDAKRNTIPSEIAKFLIA